MTTIFDLMHSLYFFVTGNDNATNIMSEIMKLLQPINASKLDKGGEGTDINPWMQAGVPGASLGNENERYFYFHHSNGMLVFQF